ncbi:hypothetical protein C7M61_002120 [Candidozyma pseudohaemuli]|uniref:Uncharacterized protein n=1 Tax=Candidozyma pseudohaemuli TaxID=418784 RepID=A0A2P7YU62_9ASCO|nr:hypothetical protein C7M61_002120 [[Candida] pseudohaemulonii]PSK39503.1 hypothetical protein C7M61_002120 [[Candida] pseudohaemulonii]
MTDSGLLVARIERAKNDDLVLRREASETQLEALSHIPEKRDRCEDTDDPPNVKRVKDDNEVEYTETQTLVNVAASESDEVNESDEEDDESGDYWSGEEEAASDWDGESVNEEDEESEFII